MKEYGTPDPDTTTYDKILAHVQGLDVAYILHNQRVPVDAKACQLPQSLRVQAVLADRTVVTAFQAAPGRPARIL